MGTIFSRLSRPIKNWNIASRAEKVISQEKPRPAPTFEATREQIQLVNQIYPDYKEIAQKKDLTLDENLKKVFVTSNTSEVNEIDTRSNPNKPLPKDKTIPEDFEYGFYEVEKVRPGRVSLRQALEFISKNAKDPQKYSVENIATGYKLETKLVENILEHYKLYEVQETDTSTDRELTATPVRVSLRSGITVPGSTVKKKKKPIDKIPEQKLPKIEDK